ncbi:MAG: hypothetical protein COW30_00950 [Rhodospirillales bacterium CG15_BIG_FIL_POST_REV_8_21_14_020_66_15]|nr:MAG: hypothetical protein COW30_00950 [Rhodospirillales bacterium CG15_BIG_FIL_POST_REV_8_21_14_020_66_15]
MVYPYSPDLMKSSSYEAEIGDTAIYWDQQGTKKTVDLSGGKEVTLQPNSLVYFETKQEFRLPDYIAIRFNLRITNVHRGLLLGTGPLVDPGFCGKLLIPIHNLTNVPYKFKGGEKFIWVEFTKISPHPRWSASQGRSAVQSGKYVPFPDDKNWRKPFQYFEKANDGNPINNAVPDALQKANETSQKAMDRAKQLTWGAILAVLTVILGLYSLFYGSWTLSSDASKLVADFQKEMNGATNFQRSASEDIVGLQERLRTLTSAYEALKAESAQIKDEIASLRNTIHSVNEQKPSPNDAEKANPSPKN